MKALYQSFHKKQIKLCVNNTKNNLELSITGSNLFHWHFSSTMKIESTKSSVSMNFWNYHKLAGIGQHEHLLGALQMPCFCSRQPGDNKYSNA